MESVFKTLDGREFQNEEKAQQHEAELLKSVQSFYVTKRTFSMNEPGGFTFNHGVILIHAMDNHDLRAEMWCQNTFGPRVIFAYRDTNPFAQWETRPIALEEAMKLTILGRAESVFVERFWNDSMIVG